MSNKSISRRKFLKVTGGAMATAPFFHTLSAFAAGAGKLEAVPRGQTLILGAADHPNRFTDVELMNPYLPGVLSRSGYQIVYEPLAFYNMLTGEEILWIAQNYVYNADYTELTVTIRQGVTWNDGRPYTAKDVAFTLTMLRDNAPTLQWSTDINQWVNDAVAVDDRTVRIILNAPNPRFFFSFLTYWADTGIFILPQHIWEGQDPTQFSNFDLSRGWPVATGPYRLMQSSPEQKIWDLRGDWWAAKVGLADLPEVRRIIYLPLYSETRSAQLLISNQIDQCIDFRVPNIQTVLAQNPNIITHSGKNPPYGYIDWWPISLGFNNLLEQFTDPEIRWAISHAINREQIVQFAYRGASQASEVPFPYYPPLMGYVDSVRDLLSRHPTNRFDPKLTEDTLSRKGYSRDPEGFWMKGGKRFSFTIYTFQVLADVAPIVVEQLRRSGFDTSFQMPTDSFQRMMTGEAEAFLMGHGGSVRDPWAGLNLYHKKFVQPTGTATYPFYRWSNDGFSDLVDRLAQEPVGTPKEKELFGQAMEIWLKELPDAQLVQWYHRIPMNTTYWTGWPTQTNSYINGANWHRTFLRVILNLKPRMG